MHRIRIAGLIGLFLGLVFSLTVPSFAEKKAFPDVNENHKYFTSITFLYDQDIFRGDADTGKFRPGDLINRAEFATIITRLLGANPSHTEYHDCFPDVSNEWYAPSVCYVLEQGIMRGFSGGDMKGKFGPDRPLLFGELLVIMARLSDWNTAFGGEWYEPAFYYAQQRNILRNKLFDEPANRGSVAEIIYRAVALNMLQVGVFHDTETPPAFEEYVESVDFDITAALKEGGDRFLREPHTVTSESGLNFVFSGLQDDRVVANGKDSYIVQFRIDDPETDDPEFSVYHDRDLRISFQEKTRLVDLDGSVSPESIDYIYRGRGYYEVTVKSKVSGHRSLVIQDGESGDIVKKELYFAPGKALRFEVLDTSGPGGPDMLAGEKHYRVAVMDEYWNPIPEAVFSGTTSNGYIYFEHNNDGTATAYLLATQYGAAEVELMAAASGQTFTITDSAFFSPVELGYEGAYVQSGEPVILPILLFIPNYAEDMTFLDLEIAIPNSIEYINARVGSNAFEGTRDFERDDMGAVKLTVSGSISHGEKRTIRQKIGELIVTSPYPQEHEISASVELYSEDPSVLKELLGDDSMIISGKKLVSPHPYSLATLLGTREKTVCIDVFVSPEVDITEAEIDRDVLAAQDMLTKNAVSSSCPYAMKVDAEITFADHVFWKGIFGETGNVLGEVTPEALQSWYEELVPAWNSEASVSEEESEEAVTPRQWCTKVFYVPEDASEAGESVLSDLFLSEDGESLYGVADYILIRNAVDRDDRALASALVHHLSGNTVRGNDAGAFQGAGQRGNLMSSDRVNAKGVVLNFLSGDDLTPAQCELIDWAHPRFNHYPPQQSPSI